MRRKPYNKGAMLLREVVKSGYKFAGEIAEDFDTATAAADSGTPFMSTPQSGCIQEDIVKLAEQIAGPIGGVFPHGSASASAMPPPEEPPPVAAVAAGPLLSRLRRHRN